MKVIILAGGWSTRLGQQTEEIPKPMVPIGNKPILWHIMKIYSHYGFNEFVISCGVKAHVIKSYFSNYEHLETNPRYELMPFSNTALNLLNEKYIFYFHVKL